MSFLRKTSNRILKNANPIERVKITRDNLNLWVTFEKLFNEGKIKFDSKGQLRYEHGAPVGEMILIGKNEDGTNIYKESAEEWFDPESQKAKDFIWP